jgi:hypothetical protein
MDRSAHLKRSLRDSRQNSTADERVIRMGATDSVSEIGGILRLTELPASASDHGILWGVPADGVGAESRTTP